MYFFFFNIILYEQIIDKILDFNIFKIKLFKYYIFIQGRDDLRQDAVMQQVFNVMNTLLKSYKDTKRRKLTIRTYKVISNILYILNTFLNLFIIN